MVALLRQSNIIFLIGPNLRKGYLGIDETAQLKKGAKCPTFSCLLHGVFLNTGVISLTSDSGQGLMDARSIFWDFHLEIVP